MFKESELPHVREKNYYYSAPKRWQNPTKISKFLGCSIAEQLHIAAEIQITQKVYIINERASKSDS